MLRPASILLCALCCAALLRAEERTTPPQPTEHAQIEIDGWTIHVDKRLQEEAHAELYKRAIRYLEAQFFTIQTIVDEEKVKAFRKVPIYLDLTCGELRTAQYHPDAGWLRAQGYSPKLVKCVHIPDVKRMVSPGHIRQQPMVMLHELAHAYHDQVLGFDHAGIKELWEKAKESKRYESVLHIGGKTTKHYLLTTHKEFFAEMTEAYFGMNDFFPFNSAELKLDNPEVFALLESIWGPPRK